jgi:putative CRISPR-associated protein (TIGR02619 family)
MTPTTKPKIIISTIGTSLLTNQVDRTNPDEKLWQKQLRDEANASLKTTSIPVRAVIDSLKQRAEEQLQQGIKAVRRASAELNGIYGIYDQNFSQAQQDMHWLIATDTAQGQVTAEIVQRFLVQHGLNPVQIYAPAGLSTQSTQHFTEGVDALIVWLQETIAPLRDRYHVIFNLVGGFKSLQGYMNTIGMFHADEIIYIFEGEGSQLIKIPRLPIEVDETALAPHALALALADAGGITEQDATGIPEIMLGDIGDRKVLSTWGLLIWQNIQIKFLSQDLLPFPCLHYAQTFKNDYARIKDPTERRKIQMVLAEVSSALAESKGDTSDLKRFKYTRYQNSNGIDHFYVDYHMRISCRKRDDCLELRYYGTHDHVEGSENV